MITRVSHRITVEDKTRDAPEIYYEQVAAEWRVFGLKIFHTTDTYECTEVNNKKENKIGFKSKTT